MRNLRNYTRLASLLLAALLALGLAGCTAPDSSLASSTCSIPLLTSSSQSAPEEAPDRSDPTLVQTALGPVQGAQGEGIVTFKNIPYAAPPLGELRFAPPQPADPWADPLDCTAFGQMATQAAGQWEAGLEYGEDCLSLNIWAPDAGDDLPVYVFIHGGAYAQGSPGKATYDGTRFARDGVIQVNIGYRLGALGFLATVQGVAESGYAGNWGLLDQIAALEWVRENIAAFGGDADNITVGGESAGSFSVSNLIMSPLAEGLFQKAILESGNLLGQPLTMPGATGDRAQAIALGDAFVAAMNAPSLDALRATADAQALAEASAFYSDMTSPNPYSFWPVFDGVALPEDPYAALQGGDYNRVSILTGFNTAEGVLFIPEGISESAYVDLVRRTFGDDAEAVLARWPVDADHSPTQRARDLFTLGLRLGGDLFAEAFAEAGLDVYCYQFNYDVGVGPVHAIELPFVFDTMDLDEAGEAFKEDLHARWLAFIKDGAPGGGTTGVPWHKYTAQGREMLFLDAQPAASVLPNTEDIAFLAGLVWGA